jgi:hypothetical protein
MARVVESGTDWDGVATLMCNDIALGKAYLPRIQCPWKIEVNAEGKFFGLFLKIML